jgi:hypothetical protein
MYRSAVFTPAVTLLSPLTAMKKGANALYIGVLHPVTLKSESIMTDWGSISETASNPSEHLR